MKKPSSSAVQKCITLIDEIFKNKQRQNIVGIIVTGFGLTTACTGIAILMNKSEEKVETNQTETSAKYQSSEKD